MREREHQFFRSRVGDGSRNPLARGPGTSPQLNLEVYYTLDKIKFALYRKRGTGNATTPRAQSVTKN